MMRIPLLVLAGFASGVVVAAGTFAFIAAIGIVPRMAQRTNTKQYIPFYEDTILLGGLFYVLFGLENWLTGSSCADTCIALRHFRWRTGYGTGRSAKCNADSYA